MSLEEMNKSLKDACCKDWREKECSFSGTLAFGNPVAVTVCFVVESE